MNRNIQRSKFGDAVKDRPVKIQVGARGSKIGCDWKAIDLFDKSPLIDENVDLHDIPYADCSVDCYVCNAVLEHLYEPQLAIFEMYRTLKVGGFVWVEVPFNQFYHAHPSDFRRWTVEGLSWEMRRFEKHGAGISAGISREVRNVTSTITRESRISKIPDEALAKIEAVLDDYSSSAKLVRLYSGTFFWGEKRSHDINDVERSYMEVLRADVARAMSK